MTTEMRNPRNAATKPKLGVTYAGGGARKNQTSRERLGLSRREKQERANETVTQKHREESRHTYIKDKKQVAYATERRGVYLPSRGADGADIFSSTRPLALRENTRFQQGNVNDGTACTCTS